VGGVDSRKRGLASPRALSATVLICAALLLWAACGPELEGNGAVTPGEKSETGTATLPRASSGKPNVILIVADDLDKVVYERSTLSSAWAPEGASFGNALVTTSLCCPSRASILRGQYAHNTGLVNNDNDETAGGAAYFRGQGLDTRTVATILQDNSYKTWFGGKYLNGYETAGGFDGYVPPGWDHWQSYLSPFSANVDGRTVPFSQHYTHWLSVQATTFVDKQRNSSKPFFMEIAPWDTHEPLYIPPRHRGAYLEQRTPRPPSFDEADVSDKPRWVQDDPPITDRQVASFDQRQVLRMQSTLTLEDLCRNLIEALRHTDELDSTYLIFTSDNGYHMGLHGIRATKFTPYTEAHEVPLVVRGPGVPRGALFEELVSNTDVVPTVLDLAEVGAPGWMDGRSLAPFLDGEPPQEWRGALLIEGARSGSPKRPAYSGVRRVGEVYVRYESGEEEYYDLREDPYQLQSKPQDAPPSIKADLESLKGCAGNGCREAEGP
jgi:N-acetylglucosamine-6-sulfatase